MLAQNAVRGQSLVPIPGTKRRRYLEDNIAALDVALSSAELAQIDEYEFAPLGVAAGSRYTEAGMATVLAPDQLSSWNCNPANRCKRSRRAAFIARLGVQKPPCCRV